MDKKKIYLLLDVIHRNGSIKNLTRQGISFNEIANLTNICIESAFIMDTDKRIILTKKGEAKLLELESNYRKVNHEEWIEKELKSKLPDLEENIIFLPNQEELFF